MRRWSWPLVLAPLLGVTAACVEAPEGASFDVAAQPAAVAGEWRLPREVVEAGNRQRLSYDGAPPWNGGAGCSGGLTPGAAALANLLDARFPQIRSIGGYACRQNTADLSRTSVHGTGRALDIFIPLDGGEADNGKGDPVANWLVSNAESLGVQYVIWDRHDWGAHRSIPKHGHYGGPHPHHDHIHAEITQEAGRGDIAFLRDLDGDGIRNERDNCPEVANNGQADRDGDGVGDRCDSCPRDANTRQVDADGDGLGDRCDNCPREANAGQDDSDGDGRGNRCDNCDNVSNRGQQDLDDDGRGDACDDDLDGDGAANDADNCPRVANAGQADRDSDGVGNACEADTDGDGVIDDADNCPDDPNPRQADTDGDGVGNACALTCAEIEVEQGDLDGDGAPDACDEDLDGDGIPNADDSCPEHATDAGLDTDTDGDGAGDACDGDDDGDGLADGADGCPLDPDPEQLDDDHDGIGDACDPTRDPDAPEDEGAHALPDDDALPTVATDPADAEGGTGEEEPTDAPAATPATAEGCAAVASRAAPAPLALLLLAAALWRAQRR